MDLSAQITFDSKAFLSYLDALPGLCDLRREPMRGYAKRAMNVLIRFEQATFVANSGSGGNGFWRPLSPVTIQKRLEKQAKDAGVKNARAKIRRAAMSVQLPLLFVTGVLEAGLFENGPGHFQQVNKSTIREGVRGGAHPDAKITVGELASIQHHGNAHIPARPVMVQPDADTTAFVGFLLAEGLQASFDALAGGMANFQAA